MKIRLKNVFVQIDWARNPKLNCLIIKGCICRSFSRRIRVSYVLFGFFISGFQPFTSRRWISVTWTRVQPFFLLLMPEITAMTRQEFLPQTSKFPQAQPRLDLTPWPQLLLQPHPLRQNRPLFNRRFPRSLWRLKLICTVDLCLDTQRRRAKKLPRFSAEDWFRQIDPFQLHRRGEKL